MRRDDLKISRLAPSAVVVAAVALAACATTGPSATPTTSVNAIYTSAFYTLSAQQATQLASTPATRPPTQTPLAAITAGLPVTGGTAVPGATGQAGTGQVCDNSAYLSDITIPDGTVVAPGQSFTKTWALMNNGTCPWTPAYRLSFLGGTAMNGSSIALTGNVEAGQQTQISVSLVAPTAPGSYTGTWRLENAVGARFGDVITVVITVSSTGSASITTTAPVATSTP